MLKWGLVNLSNGDIVKILDPIFCKVPYLYRDIPEWKNENRFVVYWVVSDFKMNQGSFNPLSSLSISLILFEKKEFKRWWGDNEIWRHNICPPLYFHMWKIDRNSSFCKNTVGWILNEKTFNLKSLIYVSINQQHLEYTKNFQNTSVIWVWICVNWQLIFSIFKQTLTVYSKIRLYFIICVIRYIRIPNS